MSRIFRTFYPFPGVSKSIVLYLFSNQINSFLDELHRLSYPCGDGGRQEEAMKITKAKVVAHDW